MIKRKDSAELLTKYSDTIDVRLIHVKDLMDQKDP